MASGSRGFIGVIVALVLLQSVSVVVGSYTLRAYLESSQSRLLGVAQNSDMMARSALAKAEQTQITATVVDDLVLTGQKRIEDQVASTQRALMLLPYRIGDSNSSAFLRPRPSPTFPDSVETQAIFAVDLHHYAKRKEEYWTIRKQNGSEDNVVPIGKSELGTLVQSLDDGHTYMIKRAEGSSMGVKDNTINPPF